LDVSAKNISIDKKNSITIFKNEVVIKDQEGNTIKSNFAQYDKKLNFFTLRDNVIVEDKMGNIFKSNNATYNENKKIFISEGKTTVLTAEGYIVESEDVELDNKENYATSQKKTIITDNQKNLIYLDNFNYQMINKIFKSVGYIKVVDKMKNSYEFSQIYIDEIKKEIIGSDAKTFFKEEQFKLNKSNKPRIFSNTINIKNNYSKFVKSSFTMCDYRDKDKCPPWVLTASEMRHDKKKKTIYYDNAVIRIYDIPIFYLPKLAHPDPTVNRRSGFLHPSFTDTKNLGSSINLPYFWAIKKDRDLTINNRLFTSEHPLFLGEYRQAFNEANLIFDFGVTEGYKNTSKTKKSGDKSHFFSKFVKKFETYNDTENNLEINLQHVSNKKYLKLYKIDTNLVDYETETLENYVDFNHFDDNNNLSLAVRTSAYRTLKDNYNDKYEYILPDITLNKNLFLDEFGFGNFQTNVKIHNYDTNRYKKFLINDFNWSFNETAKNSFYNSNFLTSLKNVNYEVKNENKFKADTSNELFGAVGYLASIDFFKKNGKNNNQLLSPKILLRYAPNHMRKDDGDYGLNGKDIFSLNRLSSVENFESGTNLTLGLDYEYKNDNAEKLNFSIGQIINEKKNNKNMPSSTSLDKRFSDIVGVFNYDNNDNFKFDYSYALDQNYKETNFNEINANYSMNNVDFNFNYLEENKISGGKEYLKSDLEIRKGSNGLLKFSNKRNLITNSSEFYNLSYEYINDCLTAGIAYRREFYNDSELESENSLMFTITLNTFGAVNSPSFSQ
jgi:LPS-assembly protein